MRYENYTANSLNQYTRRTVPGRLDVLGSATNTSVVSVNNQRAYRKSDYYRKELLADNSAGAVYQSLTNIGVINNGTNADTVTNITGSLFLPQTPETFSYDADGNLTNDGRWMLTWDGENRLVRMASHPSLPAGAQMQLDFTYDYLGRRMTKTVSNSVAQFTNRFAYDGWNLLAVLSPSNTVLQSFMWGTDLSGTMQGAGGVGGLLVIDTKTNAVHFVGYDGNGNVSALVNAADGTISAQYEYGPFGETLRAESLVAKANPLRFSTKYRDEETDWLYYGYRHYNPSVGRWGSRDPIEELGGDNIYALAANDPISNVDIDGRQYAGWGGPKPGQPPAQAPDWSKWNPYPDWRPSGNPGFSSTEGFFRWLLPIGGAKTIAWSDFDPTGQSRKTLMLSAVGKNRLELVRRIKDAPCGASTLPGMIWYDQGIFESPIAWISQYSAFASSAADPVLDKDCDSCRFSLRVRFNLIAEDTSDFNPGEHFYLGPVPIPDYPFILVRDWTPLGADYKLWSHTEEMYESNGQY